MTTPTRPSPNFTWAELTRSQTATRHGWKNEPNTKQRAALVALCTHILEPLRARVGPILVTSGFRSDIVNRQIGGSPTSQHTKGEAADIEAFDPAVSNRLLAEFASDPSITFDQVILEYPSASDPKAGWVHVSYRTGANRRQVLTARKVNGKTAYIPGLVL